MTMPYRSSIVREYYAHKQNKSTPEPFMELRVFIVSNNRIPSSMIEQMDFMLEILEWILFSIVEAYEKKSIYYETEGLEDSVWVDKDEAIDILETTGLRDPELNVIYRYAKRCSRTDDQEFEMNEKTIRKYEAERVKEYDSDSLPTFIKRKRNLGQITGRQYMRYQRFLRRLPSRFKW
jgi:hypothetical protein